MRLRNTIACGQLIVVAVFAVSSAKAQQFYYFQEIAMVAPPNTPFYAPALNNAGTVAFASAADNKIYTGNGGPSATSIGVAAFPVVSINGGGTVAFPGFTGLETGSGGAITTILGRDAIVNGIQYSYFTEPSINDAGTVAFAASFQQVQPPGSQQGQGIYTSTGGAPTLIADVTDPFFSFDSVLIPPVINNSGVVAYSPTVDGLPYTDVIRTNTAATIASTSGIFSFLFGPSSINDSGTVAFTANLEAGGSGVFTGSGGPTTMVAYSPDPSKFGSAASINDSGTVAFKRDLEQGRNGIFTGDDTVQDKVIESCDCLLGRAQHVTSVVFGREGLNDANEIAFAAHFADGSTGVFRADPAPAPTAPEIVIAIRYEDGGTLSSATKDRIKFVMQKKLEGVFLPGEIPVRITDNPAEEASAKRLVRISLAEPADNPNYGEWIEETNESWVYVPRFFAQQAFFNDTRLGNGIGETAAHEIGHSFGLLHNFYQSSPSLITAGVDNTNAVLVPPELRATGVRCVERWEAPIARFNSSPIIGNLAPRGVGVADLLTAASDRDALGANDDNGLSLDAMLTVSGPLGNDFDIGHLVEATTGGLTFAMRAPAGVMSAVAPDAPVLTLFDGSTIQWALHGAEGTPQAGEVFTLADFGTFQLTEPVFNSSLGQNVFQRLEMNWDVENDGTDDVLMVLDASLDGDYNQNGIVDAADYTVWRDHLGQNIALPNENADTSPGQVTEGDFVFWRAHFGEIQTGGFLPLGSLPSPSSIPEPTSLVLLALAALIGKSCHRAEFAVPDSGDRQRRGWLT